MGSRVEFDRQPRRSRVEAWVLDSTAARINAQFGREKRAAIGAMTGTVVEIGPGTGVNMAFYSPGVRVIAIEPNPHLHPKLRQQAEDNGVDLEIRSLRGEHLDVDDGAADGVVGTLVLCGVEDPRQVLAEVRRVLAPRGTYFFIEHVVAPDASWTRRVQQVAKRPHRWLFNGCEVDRDTEASIRSAGFDHVQLRRADAGWRGVYVRYQIVGTATN